MYNFSCYGTERVIRDILKASFMLREFGIGSGWFLSVRFMDIGMIIFDYWDKIRNTYIRTIKMLKMLKMAFVASFTKIVKKHQKSINLERKAKFIIKKNWSLNRL
jgi:hypothetical protein